MVTWWGKKLAASKAARVMLRLVPESCCQALTSTSRHSQRRSASTKSIPSLAPPIAPTTASQSTSRTFPQSPVYTTPLAHHASGYAAHRRLRARPIQAQLARPRFPSCHLPAHGRRHLHLRFLARRPRYPRTKVCTPPPPHLRPKSKSWKNYIRGKQEALKSKIRKTRDASNGSKTQKIAAERESHR